MTIEQSVDPGLAPDGVYLRLECSACGTITSHAVTGEAIGRMGDLPELIGLTDADAAMAHIDQRHVVALLAYDGDDGHRMGSVTIIRGATR